MRVTVIGTGYVGTVTGACLAYLGHRVTCIDQDAEKIARLRRGDMPIYEPFLAELIELGAERGGIEFSTDLAPAVAASDLVFIAVGTPPLPSGEANLCYLESAARGIGAAMDDTRYRVVVNKSTVPVGCGNLVEALIREGMSAAGADRRSVAFGVASNPEFLREGCAISDSLFPDRIVVGAESHHAMTIMRDLYAPLVEGTLEVPDFLASHGEPSPVPFLSTSLTSAEMIKYAANSFLAMKIGFANEMANVCERIGADAMDVMAGIGLDSRIGRKFLNPGLGWGGSCFGKDVQSILHTAKEYGCEARLLESTLAVNRAQRQIVVQKLQEKLYILKGCTVALLGLAFKPDTDDLRDAPSLEIAARLIQSGVRVRAYDPVAMTACQQQYPELRMQYCSSALEAALDADAVVLVTEWSEFAELPLPALAAAMKRPVLIDGRNVLDPRAAIAAGFDYTGVGRSVARRQAPASHSGAAEPESVRTNGVASRGYETRANLTLNYAARS